jgi:hypothetical protein
MMKHFVLNLNPAAQFEWERCSLHHPITAEQPDFAELIAASVRESVQNSDRSSSYLIAVKLDVVVLESSVAESMADHASEIMPNAIPKTVPNSFPNSIAIPLIEPVRSVRSVPERVGAA